MPNPLNITETTTLGELREHLLLCDVIALRLYPPVGREEPRAASLHHASGIHVGYGPTEATAIEAAFIKLHRALLPEERRQDLQEDTP